MSHETTARERTAVIRIWGDSVASDSDSFLPCMKIFAQHVVGLHQSGDW
jgi:hypothetical protein